MQATIKQTDKEQIGGRTPPVNGTGIPLEDQRLSHYLCPWCRNGRSLNEAHENCLAGGKFDRFWPVVDAVVGNVPPFPVREVAAGKLSPQETRVIVYFYLYMVVKACQDTEAKT